jgi:hypothetical protein
MPDSIPNSFGQLLNETKPENRRGRAEAIKFKSA